jgi:acetolactate synthase regulatory subunit
METKVKVIYNYRDVELDRAVLVGEEFVVDSERAEMLVARKLVKVLEVVEEEIVEKEEKEEVKTKELKITKKTK